MTRDGDLKLLETVEIAKAFPLYTIELILDVRPVITNNCTTSQWSQHREQSQRRASNKKSKTMKDIFAIC